MRAIPRFGFRQVWGAAIAACVLLASPAAAQRTLQLVEDSASTRALTLDIAGSGTRQVCEPGATWLRLGIATLALQGTDSVVLRSAGGDQATFSGTTWNGRSFHTRAMRGACVDVETRFANSGSRLVLEELNAGSLPLAQSTALIAGAGDICDYTPIDCRRTSDVVISLDPLAAFVAGDNVYNHGSLAQYEERFDPNWGRFKPLILPVPGNHEYWTSGAAGYFDYFNGVGERFGPAGERGNGWWSVDVGDWHVIGLNTRTNGTSATAQLTWLSADLAANTKPCTAALFHHPLVSVGEYSGYSGVKPIWDRLYAARADLVINGHDHNYQRYAPMDGSATARADGLVQLVVGTGGANLYNALGSHSLLRASQATAMGVLALTLSPVGYEGRFAPVAGATYADSFSGSCHKATVAPPPASGDFALSNSATMAIDPGRTGGKIITVTSSDGFSAPVTMSVSGLPTGVTGSFETNPVTPPANGSATSRLVLRASTGVVAGTYTVTVTGTAGSLVRTSTFRLFVH
jgi:hypothetical protein